MLPVETCVHAKGLCPISVMEFLVPCWHRFRFHRRHDRQCDMDEGNLALVIPGAQTVCCGYPRVSGRADLLDRRKYDSENSSWRLSKFKMNGCESMASMAETYLETRAIQTVKHSRAMASARSGVPIFAPGNSKSWSSIATDLQGWSDD